MRRRRFMTVVGGAALATAGSAQAQTVDARLTLGRGPEGRLVSEDFIGLSYECQQLADPSFFAAENRELVAAFRTIARRGVLRLGGNTSEFSWWRERPDAAAPARRSTVSRPGEPASNTLYAITPVAIDALASFLRAADWRCIYGLNLGLGQPAALAREAAYVQAALGDRLLMFALGNEPDLYGRHLRDPASWSVDQYMGEWLAAARALLQATPQARFSMPDAANALDWLPAVAERLSRQPAQLPIAAMSHHFYFGGPPADPQVNTRRLLQPDPRIAQITSVAEAAARRVGARPRLTEANTCYQGGKPGVSDVYASALWTADLCLRLMAAGYEGVHLHGGSASAVGASVGGLAGDALATGGEPHPRPYYTPIADLDGRLQLQPDAQGLRFAGLFAGSRVISSALDAGDLNASAFAGRRRTGDAVVAIVNKDTTHSLSIRPPRHRVLATLTGPALDSREAHYPRGRARAGERRGARDPAHLGDRHRAGLTQSNAPHVRGPMSHTAKAGGAAWRVTDPRRPSTTSDAADPART